MPVNDQFSAFGRLGLQYAQAKDNFSSTGAVPVPSNSNPSKKSTQYKAGVGLQYDFTESFGMRAEAERYRIDDAVGSKGDINMYSLGLVYRFNEKKPAPVQKAATPPPPPPRHIDYSRPVIVIVPVKVKTQQYCSILYLTFELNRDVIQRDDKEKLKVVGTFMTKYPDTTALIEGHSDDVGDSESNLKLSQQRADSMVDYLVNNFRIDPSSLTEVGSENRARSRTIAPRKGSRRTGVSTPSSRARGMSRVSRLPQPGSPWRWNSSSTR